MFSGGVLLSRALPPTPFRRTETTISSLVRVGRARDTHAVHASARTREFSPARDIESRTRFTYPTLFRSYPTVRPSGRRHTVPTKFSGGVLLSRALPPTPFRRTETTISSLLRVGRSRDTHAVHASARTREFSPARDIESRKRLIEHHCPL